MKFPTILPVFNFNQSLVRGGLLGEIKNGVIEIFNSFEFKQENSIDIEFIKDKLEQCIN